MKKKILILLSAGLIMAAGCENKSDLGSLPEEGLAQPITEEETGYEDKSSSEDNDSWKDENTSEINDTPGTKPGSGADDGAKTETHSDAGEYSYDTDDSDLKTQEAAYASVLKDLYETYTLPDGRNLGYDGILDLSFNKFAIYDIDRDGKDELIILWTTTITAGMSQIVYGYDSETGEVREELFEYPAQTFYDNGVTEVGLSHNHGLAGDMDIDFWPYTLYRYDQGRDIYAVIAEVDAWNKSFREEDFDGNLFPDDIDADGDGIVYKITEGNDVKLMDLAEYEKWKDSFTEGAKKTEIPFQEMKGSY